MATFAENNRTEQKTIIVNATYVLSDGSIQTVDVPVFMPQSEDDIQSALINRGETIEAILSQSNQ